MKDKIKLKDLVLIALLTVIYFLIYMIGMLFVTLLGPLGHAISPGICALFSGAIIIFMNRKVGKMWEYTIFTILIMATFSLLGGGYIPWYITSISMAVIADIFASKTNDTAIWKLGIASGFIHVGQACGAIIPSIFFLDRYRAHWIERGMSPQDMDNMIKYTKGAMGFAAIVVVFVMAFIGIYLGHLILRKHLDK